MHFCQVYQKATKLLDVIERIHDHKQIQWLLLYRFDNINKINYYLRNVPYSKSENWIILFDQLEQRKRDLLFGTGLTLKQINQSQLATKEGGLSLRTPTQFYSAANLASKVKNCLLMSLLLTPEVIRATDNHVNKPMDIALLDYNSRVLPDDRIDNIVSYFDDQRRTNPYPKLQSKLFSKIDKQIKSNILSNADRHTQALFKQFQHKKCHNWLQTDPWLLQLSNFEFLTSLYRRFRVPIFPTETPCPACHVRVMDVFGDHATMCNTTTQNPKRRHDTVKSLLKSMGLSAGLVTKVEQNPTTTTTSNIKPADVLFENYDNGEHMAIDVTIISPFRSGVSSGAASQFMHTADETYIDKLQKYKQHTFKPHYLFRPFVIEEFGAVHKEGMKVFNRLCEFIAIRQNKDLTTIKFHYSKLLSSTIQRQNSRAILSRS